MSMHTSRSLRLRFAAHAIMSREEAKGHTIGEIRLTVLSNGAGYRPRHLRPIWAEQKLSNKKYKFFRENFEMMKQEQDAFRERLKADGFTFWGQSMAPYADDYFEIFNKYFGEIEYFQVMEVLRCPENYNDAICKVRQIKSTLEGFCASDSLKKLFEKLNRSFKLQKLEDGVGPDPPLALRPSVQPIAPAL